MFGQACQSNKFNAGISHAYGRLKRLRREVAYRRIDTVLQVLRDVRAKNVFLLSEQKTVD